MFCPEISPITTFEGFTVKCFRQGRVNLAERRLTRTQVYFAPLAGVVGVFLHAATSAVETALLEAAWRAQGMPRVTRPDAHHLPLFGRLLPIQRVPFAGYEDVWEADGALQIAFKRSEPAGRAQELAASFARHRLLTAAESLLTTFQPRLIHSPKRIEIAPLRPRILGQCTREGVIRLNESLVQWPEAIMEETLAHELVHLEHFNHSPAFWRRLSELLPDWLPRSLVHYL